ncbi:MAG: hypothetical protein O3B64_03330 [bacterium]|nr:hypothetical protein [bacterium]MDA1024442.1 hypothetical protein [bacterium]
MKKTGGKKPRSHIQALYDIRDSIQNLEPKKGFAKFFDHFLVGILRGLGFALGSTVVLTIVIVIMRSILTSGAVSKVVKEAFESQIIELIQEQSAENRD